MKQKAKLWMMVLVVCMVGVIGIGGTVEASPEHTVWLGPSGGGGWNTFMQIILQQDYRMQMSNGNPYWNALMIPVAESSISSGMSSYMGMPAFGFCPVVGQCYMVLVQRPSSYSPMTCPPVPPVVPGQTVPVPQGKPTSLW